MRFEYCDSLDIEACMAALDAFVTEQSENAHYEKLNLGGFYEWLKERREQLIKREEEGQ